MGSSKVTICSILLSLGLAIAVKAAAQPPKAGRAQWKHQTDSTRTGSPKIESLQSGQFQPGQPLRKMMAYASNCTVYVDEPQYALYDWLVGDEIYYAYQDLQYPKFTCDTTYPFVVTHVGMTLALNDTGTVVVQVFLATVDPVYSSPVCPVPYELISLSDQYGFTIPEPNVYSLIVPFEVPVPVYEPYFACIYYGSDLSNMYPGIAIDTTPYLCINYNDWGYGLVDLADNEYYPFPGSIHLFSIGYSKAGTMPKPRIILPNDSGLIFPGNTIWAAELQDTFPYESARFDYFKAGQWYTIGSDFDGTVALRDGVSPAFGSNGWAVNWQPYGLTEGNYSLRVSIADTDSTFVSDTASVYLDLKHLEPSFVGRSDFESACGPESLTVTIQDENPIAVTFGRRNITTPVERVMQLLKRNDYGDANGITTDGNHEYNGEFGEFYVAPTLFGSFLKHWYDKGYIELMLDGSQFMTVPQTVEKLATIFKTRANRGTEDDDLVYALRDYLKTHGNRIDAEIMRRPNWSWFKDNYLGRDATTAFAISNPFGTWLAVEKVDLSNGKADSLPVTFYDPIGGLLRDSYLKIQGDSLLLGYLPNNKKYPIDLGIALHPKQETITYLTFGTDFDGLDGFKAILSPLQEDLFYLVRARALDANDQVGDSYWLMKYNCFNPAQRGDNDNSGSIEITDAVYMITYIFHNGPPPMPNPAVGDSDCSGIVDISDAVFLIHYIFLNGPAPCPL